MNFAPPVLDVRSQDPIGPVPVQVSVPSLTMTFPVGVPLPGVMTVT